MLSFKQFILESVESQLDTVSKQAKKVAKSLKSLEDFPDGIKAMAFTKDEAPARLPGANLDTYFATLPPDNVKLGTQRLLPPDEKSADPINLIKIFTDKPELISDPDSRVRSTLEHELAHGYQSERQFESNPEFALSRTKSKKFDDTKMKPGINALQKTDDNHWTKDFFKQLSYETDPHEVNARGMQLGLEAQRKQNKLARGVIINRPEYADFELNLEKSRGTLQPPELDRVPQSARMFGRDVIFPQVFEPEKDSIDFYKQALPDMVQKPSDANKINKTLEKTKKAIQSDIGRAILANQGAAEQEMHLAYSDKVTTPMRERQQRVGNTQAEVEGMKAKYGGFQTSPFLSDPLSTANMAADMSGALGDVHSKAQTTTKAQSSLYNPMFSDSEQMMGDAFLRGGGEEYQVDPRFLQVQRQREKDRQKEKQK
jgi:hypothetical protein